MQYQARSLSLTRIAAAVGVSQPTVMREAFRPSLEPVAVTFAPLRLLREMLHEVEGVREAYIYG